MNAEAAPKGGSGDSRSEVESKSTAGERHDEALTIKQRGRFSAMTVDGILARDPITAQASDLALALGKGMRRDGTFDTFRGSDDLLCVEVRASHRDKVLELLQLSAWSWGEYVRRWEAAGLAHRCSSLNRGTVRLFLRPEISCPACGETVALSNAERGSEQRSTLPTATENVLTAGDASRDEEGDGLQTRGTGNRLSDSPSHEGSPEIGAIAALKRAGITIGNPMTDEEIKALGYRATARGWVPIREVSHAA